MLIWLIGLIICGALLSVFINPLLILAIAALLTAIIYLARHLDFGLIILVFFFPYLGLVIDFGAIQSLREVPYLKNVNAPFIDLYGLILFVAWIAHIVLSSRGRRPWRSFGDCFATLAMTLRGVHFKSYLLFWLSGLVSLLRVSSAQLGVSVKYLVRPFTFFYMVFFVPIVSILTSSNLNRVLTVFYATGLLSAFNGLLGLLFGVHAEFPRAMPFGFFGVSPLGPNHNLLAETLVATAPVGLILAYQAKLSKSLAWYDRWIRYGMFFQWTIALLTFARTAWIAIGLQAIVYCWYTYRGRFREMWPRVKWGFLAILLPLTILALTTLTETVRGSTLSRLDQARISAFYFLRSPLVGQGIGTFVPTLWQTRAFLLEYGDPLEAHGVIFKLMFEQGLFGLIAFGVLVGSMLRSLIRAYHKNARVELLSALMIAAGSLTYQLFNTTYYTAKLWVPLAIAVAIAKTSKLSFDREKA